MSTDCTPNGFPEDLRQFIVGERWTFAKTMPEWPHEYIVRQRVDRVLFEKLAAFIRSHGFQGHFYEHTHLYFCDGDLRYWVIGNIVNRCLEHDSYDARLARGDLPSSQKP